MLRASFAGSYLPYSIRKKHGKESLMLLQHTKEVRKGKSYVIAAYERDRKEYGI